jgi:hypothetical protein
LPIDVADYSASQTQLQAAISGIISCDTAGKVEFRLVRLDVWGKTDGTVVKVVGFDTDGNDVLFDRTDYGSYARRASVHYIYGDKQNQDVLPNTIAAPGYTVWEVSNGSVAYAHVLFRVRVAAPTRSTLTADQRTEIVRLYDELSLTS